MGTQSSDLVGVYFLSGQNELYWPGMFIPEVERVQKYSTQVKVPLHYCKLITLLKFYLSTSKSTSLKIYSSKSKK